jgi:hypothetical protein
MHYITGRQISARAKSPIDFIDSLQFRIVLGVLAKQYDVIIVDSPPLQVVSHGLYLASMQIRCCSWCDGPGLPVRWWPPR